MSEKLYGKWSISEWIMFVECVRFHDATSLVSIEVDDLEAFIARIQELEAAMDFIENIADDATGDTKKSRVAVGVIATATRKALRGEKRTMSKVETAGGEG